MAHPTLFENLLKIDWQPKGISSEKLAVDRGYAVLNLRWLQQEFMKHGVGATFRKNNPYEFTPINERMHKSTKRGRVVEVTDTKAIGLDLLFYEIGNPHNRIKAILQVDERLNGLQCHHKYRPHFNINSELYNEPGDRLRNTLSFLQQQNMHYLLVYWPKLETGARVKEPRFCFGSYRMLTEKDCLLLNRRTGPKKYDRLGVVKPPVTVTGYVVAQQIAKAIYTI